MTGSELTVLDMAEIYKLNAGAGMVKKVLKMYRDLQALKKSLELGGGIIELAEHCNITKNGIQF